MVENAIRDALITDTVGAVAIGLLESRAGFRGIFGCSDGGCGALRRSTGAVV